MKDDTISRSAAIKAADSIIERDTSGNNDVVKAMTAWKEYIKGLPSAQPEITNEEIRFALKQLGVYFAIKIRDGKDGSIPVELRKLVEEIQEYFENTPSAQPDIPDMNDIIDTIKNAINASTGNEAYMVGLRNGMRWCLLVLTDKEPEYEDMPSAQPECEDTISRSHFDERVRLAGGISEEELTDDFKDGVLTVLEMLRTEPPVTPKQPGWIPCGERLPEKYDSYLITTEDGMVVFGVYDPKEEQWSRYDSIKSWWLYGIKVLAWQPLPTPYRKV